MIKMAHGSVAVFSNKNAKVSGWNVGEHLEHTALTMAAMNGRLLEALDAEHNTRAGPTWAGRVVLLTGFIPRGRGKAPQVTLPPDNPTPERIVRNLSEARKKLAELERNLAEIEIATGRSAHPVLGQFSPAEWLRFIDIHNRHHLKIIREINGSASK